MDRISPFRVRGVDIPHTQAGSKLGFLPDIQSKDSLQKVNFSNEFIKNPNSKNITPPRAHISIRLDQPILNSPISSLQDLGANSFNHESRTEGCTTLRSIFEPVLRKKNFLLQQNTHKMLEICDPYTLAVDKQIKLLGE
jgi:hypothetical protein